MPDQEMQLPSEFLKVMLELKGAVTSLGGKVDMVDTKLDHQIERTKERTEALRESLEQKLSSVHTLIESGDRAVQTSVGMLITGLDRLEEHQVDQGRRLRAVEDKEAADSMTLINNKRLIDKHDEQIGTIEDVALKARDTAGTLDTAVTDLQRRTRIIEDTILSYRSKVAGAAAVGGLGGGGIVAGILKAIGKI